VHSRHELGKHWASEDGVVGEVEVRHVKDNILGVDVVPFPERDGQLDLPQGNCLPISDTIERHRWEQLAFPDLHLVEHLQGEEVETRSPINEDSSHPEVADREGHDHGKDADPRRVVQVVVPVKGNWCTRPF
jgi:hypothetical protein